MSDEKVLTKEVAEQLLADENSVDLSAFTAIEDDEAGLKTLSVTTVKQVNHISAQHLI